MRTDCRRWSSVPISMDWAGCVTTRCGGPVPRPCFATRLHSTTALGRPGPKATCWPPPTSPHQRPSRPTTTGRSPPLVDPFGRPERQVASDGGLVLSGYRGDTWSQTLVLDPTLGVEGGLSRTITRRDARGQILESWEDKGAPAIDPSALSERLTDGAVAVCSRFLHVRRRRPQHQGRDPRARRQQHGSSCRPESWSSTPSVNSSPTPSPSTAPATARSFTKTSTPSARPGALSFR